MGQKVHPIGFRVGITKKYQSQWFARFQKNHYAQSVLEDQLLRKTCLDLFPQLLNPLAKKRDQGNTVNANITHIKIERYKVPYGIEIQIHAKNCELLKSALMQLKTNTELSCKLQKFKQHLFNLKKKLGSNDSETINVATTKVVPSGKKKTTNRFKQRKNALRRFKKRQFIRQRFLAVLAPGLYLKKKGKTVIQKFRINPNVQQKRSNLNVKLVSTKFNTKLNGKLGNSMHEDKKLKSLQDFARLNELGRKKQLLRRKQKFVQIYLSKMENKFNSQLKEILLQCDHTMKKARDGQFAPLGYNRKWNLNRLKKCKRLGDKSFIQFMKLVTRLENKVFKKYTSLKKEFIAFGHLSKARVFGYYQMLVFVKHLVKFARQKQQDYWGLLSKKTTPLLHSDSVISNNVSSNTKIEKRLQKRFQNFNEEIQKYKFIEYLTDVVKKHRTENIYHNLSTLAEARQQLKKIKSIMKENAKDFFGLDSTGLDPATAKERVTQVMKDLAKKPLPGLILPGESETLRDKNLYTLEKERNTYKANLALTPSILIKFYTVKSTDIEAKAATISASVADALEKRKAFRKVIKDAKNSLMKMPKVKGVKIQVSGRLNGAEIARSEWVRAGRVPLQTLRANIDYSARTAQTIYGIIGVKVWIFKGYLNS